MGGIILPAIQHALERLDETQEQDGGFVSYSWPADENYDESLSYKTVFASALILNALHGVGGGNGVCDRLAEYLRHQQGQYASFNYWERKSKEVIKRPYPDDLDDTFCALLGLSRRDPKFMDGELLARVAQILITAEQKPGGPYRTWLVSSDLPEWNDVDVAVNANTAAFLMHAGVDLPNVTAFIEDAIARKDLTSPYYPADFPILYFISRWYRGPFASDCIELLLHRRNEKGNWGNHLDTALAAVALLNFEVPHEVVEPAIEWLVEEQDQGMWAGLGFCYDPSIRNQPFVSGSQALTTAFCVEALAAYERQAAKASVGKESLERQDIWNQAAERLSGWPPPLKQPALALLQRMRQQDADGQIIGLPYAVAAAYGLDAGKATLERLSLASLYGWMSYTILDDVIDGDVTVGELPLGTAVMRLMRQQFLEAVPNESFQTLVDERLLAMDAACSWELAHCRFDPNGELTLSSLPKFRDHAVLFDRSSGHILSAVGALVAAGFSEQDSEIQTLQQFFHHFIIARQLNDDAHDWKEDLQQGRINAVATLTLKRWGRREKVKAFRFSHHVATVQQQFWQDDIKEVATLIYDHIKAARTQLTAVSPQSRKLLESLLIPLERATDQALKQRQNAQDFMSAFDAKP
jgi:hypothetical protein